MRQLLDPYRAHQQQRVGAGGNDCFAQPDVAGLGERVGDEAIPDRALC